MLSRGNSLFKLLHLGSICQNKRFVATKVNGNARLVITYVPYPHCMPSEICFLVFEIVKINGHFGFILNIAMLVKGFGDTTLEE